jgi:homoaconitase/3-isopropylmalate dehydratase large subunit
MGARGGMIAPDQKTFDSLKEDCMLRKAWTKDLNTGKH